MIFKGLSDAKLHQTLECAFKDYLPQISLGPFLNTLSHILQ